MNYSTFLAAAIFPFHYFFVSSFHGKNIGYVWSELELSFKLSPHFANTFSVVANTKKPKMKEIIEKITSYNLFNYLFPGVIFVIFLKEFTSYNLLQENNFIGAFLYYFVGLIISRFGSLVIGDILKKLTFIKFTNYSDYIFASNNDDKIELFSEVNNMYRTIISLLTLLLFSKFYELIANWLNFSETLSYILLIIVLIILFVFSYKKQTDFVVKRVVTQIEKK